MPMDLNELKELLMSSLTRLETKVDNINSKQNDVNEKVIVLKEKTDRNSDDIDKLKEKCNKMSSRIIYFTGGLAALIFTIGLALALAKYVK